MPLISGLTVFENNVSNSLVALDNNFTTIANAVNTFGNSGSYLASGATFLTASGLLVTGSTVPTNGMYLPAANTVGIAANSVLIFSATSSGVTLPQPLIGPTTISGSTTFGDNPSNLIQTNPIAFHAHRSTNQTSGSTVIFDTVDNQNGGTNYSNSTGLFTAPVNGWYVFSGSVFFSNGTGSSQTTILGVLANSVQVAQSSAPGTLLTGASMGITVSSIAFLSLGQTCGLTVVSSGPGAFTATFIALSGAPTSFSGSLLARTS